MKKIVILLLVVSMTAVVSAQESSLSLQQCYLMAIQNHPLSAQNALLEKSSQLQQKIWDENNLPQLNLNGQVTYQSAVTELPIKIPNITVPEIPRDQFKVTLDANQVIYGGGTVLNQNLVEQNNLAISKQGTETDLYKIKERINLIYFNILLTNNTLDILKINKEELETRLKKIESGVKNGVLLPVNATILKAEIIKVEQKQIENESQRTALTTLLGVLVGSTVPDNTKFAEPDILIDLNHYSNLRPEFRLFDLQQQKMNAMKNLTLTRKNPRVFAFGNLGYGRPGLNMFKEEAELFYIVGAKVTWNFWNWHQTSQEIQMLDLSKEMIENQKKAFDLNTRASIQQFLSDITKTSELLKTDDEIIALRAEITANASAQLENGVITATEYLTEYNAEVQARLLKSLHEIQLIQAKAGYQAATGNL
jgi:outer membrane protein TolC